MASSVYPFILCLCVSIDYNLIIPSRQLSTIYSSISFSKFSYFSKKQLFFYRLYFIHFVFKCIYPLSTLGYGFVSTSVKDEYYSDRTITDISDSYKGFYQDDLDCGTHIEYGKLDFSRTLPCNKYLPRLQLNSNEYIDLAMKENSTGLFSFEIKRI